MNSRDFRMRNFRKLCLISQYKPHTMSSMRKIRSEKRAKIRTAAFQFMILLIIFILSLVTKALLED